MLRQNWEAKCGFHYDWVIRARPDALFHKPIEDLSTLDPNFLYVPNFDNHRGLNDRFAFGGPEIMDVYSNKAGLALDYMCQDFEVGSWKFFNHFSKKTIYINSEHFLAWWIVTNKIVVKRTNVLFQILRDPDEEKTYADQGEEGVPQTGEQDTDYETLKHRIENNLP
jgi:hypothetical protein